jgi:hypothetical protein
MTYWQWLRSGSGGPPGYRSVVNGWLLLHATVGAILAALAPSDLRSAANTVLLPLFGVFVGISFAWAGNAHALLQTRAIDEISKRVEGGFTHYVFLFQTAILVLLGTLSVWAVAGLGVFGDAKGPFELRSWMGVLATALYALLSLSIRECWHIVLATQMMLLAWREVQPIIDSEE